MDALMNNSNDLMWSVDTNFKLITSNKPFDDFLEVHGRKKVKEGGNILKVAITNGESNAYKKLYERAFAGESFTEIVYNDLPYETWAEISFCPIKMADGVLGTACHSHDITERLKGELDRKKLVKDLLVRNTDLEQFGYIISHNLRAPVVNIIGASSALMDAGLSAEDKEILNNGINTSVIRLDNVIKDLNHILQVKGDLNHTKENIHFSALVDDIKTSIQNLIDQYHIDIRYDFTEVDEFVTFQPYLYSIFYNLISNSIKYRRERVHTTIQIKSGFKKNKVEICFRDNGMGIDLKKNGRDVFGLYKRFHSSIEGKGMGLFMAKTQVEALGGKISVKSVLNEGTEFKIELDNA